MPHAFFIWEGHLCAPLIDPITDHCPAVMMSNTGLVRGYHNLLSEQLKPWVTEHSHQTNSGQIGHPMLTQHPPPTHPPRTYICTYTHTHTKDEVTHKFDSVSLDLTSGNFLLR